MTNIEKANKIAQDAIHDGLPGFAHLNVDNRYEDFSLFIEKVDVSLLRRWLAAIVAEQMDEIKRA